jgi:hypothetical protein
MGNHLQRCNKSTVLPKEIKHELKRVRQESYGIGFEICREKDRKIVGHSGVIGSYRSGHSGIVEIEKGTFVTSRMKF